MINEKLSKILDYLEENPNATNDEITKGTGLDKNYIKVMISRLKTRGKINTEYKEGKRTIKILQEYKREDLIYCEEVTIRTLFKLVELNDKENTGEEIRANAKLIYQYIQLIKRV